ncbi:MAG TPA: ribosome silencing factor [Syntrophaceae bacterium]|nr:ribosome silencing factor [Syntrophaceae bacterium]
MKVLKDMESREKSRLCIHAALNKKALDLILLDVRKVSSFADYFIICSGQSSRHVQGIASFIEESLAKQGIYPLGIEGFTQGSWILMDYNEVIIHIFYKPIREFYDLEGLWSGAKRIETEFEELRI